MKEEIKEKIINKINSLDNYNLLLLGWEFENCSNTYSDAYNYLNNIMIYNDDSDIIERFIVELLCDKISKLEEELRVTIDKQIIEIPTEELIKAEDIYEEGEYCFINFTEEMNLFFMIDDDYHTEIYEKCLEELKNR